MVLMFNLLIFSAVICNVPMNVDVPGLVADSQMSASSDQGAGTLASDGRLNVPVTSWQPGPQ